MTSADRKWQLEGFRNRAADEGDLSEFLRAVAAERQLEADAEAHARAYAASRPHRPPMPFLTRVKLWAVLVVAGLLLVMFRPNEVLGLVLLAVAVYAVRRWQRSKAPVPVPLRPMAPPKKGDQAAPGLLDEPLPKYVRALASALPDAKARVYVDAWKRELIFEPEAERGQGSLFIKAQLPGGQILPTDFNVARIAQTLGYTSDTVRRVEDAAAGHLVVEVYDVRPRDRVVGAWPHLGQRTAFGEPMALGVDERGAVTRVDIAGRRLLVAGQSGSGKTRLIRTAALYAASDPNVVLSMLDMKRSPALVGVRRVAEHQHSGPVTPELRDHLREVVDDVRDRYRRFESGEDVVAVSGWRVVAVDEAQILFSDKVAAELIQEIALTGREAGVGLIMGIHSNTKASVSWDVLGAFDVRVAMRLTDSSTTHSVLQRAGISTADLPDGHAVVNNRGQLVSVATFHVDDSDAEDQLRVIQPVAIEGRAPVQDVAPAAPRVLSVADAAMASRGGSGMSWAELADLFDIVDEDGVDALQATFREYGVTSQTIRTEAGESTRGVRRSALREVLETLS